MAGCSAMSTRSVSTLTSPRHDISVKLSSQSLSCHPSHQISTSAPHSHSKPHLSFITLTCPQSLSSARLWVSVGPSCAPYWNPDILSVAFLFGFQDKESFLFSYRPSICEYANVSTWKHQSWEEAHSCYNGSLLLIWADSSLMYSSSEWQRREGLRAAWEAASLSDSWQSECQYSVQYTRSYHTLLMEIENDCSVQQTRSNDGLPSLYCKALQW